MGSLTDGNTRLPRGEQLALTQGEGGSPRSSFPGSRTTSIAATRHVSGSKPFRASSAYARWRRARGSATRARDRPFLASSRRAASRSTSVPSPATRRSSSTTSVIARSTPFSASSCRSARSPRGRARSRDSTQARANCSSSRMPSSPSRSTAAVDEVRSIAGRRQSAPDLRDGTRPRLEEPHRRLEDDRRILDFRMRGAPFGGIPRATSHDARQNGFVIMRMNTPTIEAIS